MSYHVKLTSARADIMSIYWGGDMSQAVTSHVVCNKMLPLTWLWSAVDLDATVLLAYWRCGLLLLRSPSVRILDVCDDASNRASEILKQDFSRLLHSLNDCGKCVFISGPIPSPSRGVGGFSRTLSVQIRGSSLVCTVYNTFFIDNFNLFGNRPYFYLRDDVRPGRLGEHTLTNDFFYSVNTKAAWPCRRQPSRLYAGHFRYPTRGHLPPHSAAIIVAQTH